MRKLIHTILVLTTFVEIALGVCTDVRIDFQDKTQISCPLGQYMRGLTRGKISGKKDKIDDIVKLKCCTPSEGLSEASLVDYADWEDSFDKKNKWNACPLGYFAQGLQRGTVDRLEGIQAGRCAKPVDHPHEYMGNTCYELNVNWGANQNAYAGCNNNSFVVSFYRGGGNDLSDLDKLRCCQMSQPPELNTIDGVKTIVMDKTRPGLADLAHFLGFGWCFGCRALNVGEHFTKSGNSWIASTNGDCADGYNKKNRLKIEYDDWRMVTAMTPESKSVVFLEPEPVESFFMINDEGRPLKQVMSKTFDIVRSVTHLKQRGWRDTSEIDVVFSNARANYSFSYEDATKTKDTTGQQKVDSFYSLLTVTIPPHSTANFTWTVTKKSYFESYTARVRPECSVTLESFLRGGMSKNPGDNYHKDYNGRNKRPDFSYTFGDQDSWFVDELNQEYKEKSLPWQWNKVQGAWPNTDDVVEDLVDKTQYEFQVSGEFVQVSGFETNLETSDNVNVVYIVKDNRRMVG